METINFEQLGLTRQFLDAVHEAGFTQPTAIQIQAIPSIRSGQHLIGIAQTGTGKTAAYLLPILQNLKYAQGTTPRCIILVPTKELVVQVTEQIAALVKYTNIRFAGLYGGVGRKAQAAQIAAGLDLIVSTPRRLMELYEDENLVLKYVQVFVLDEADRMLDMGFRPQINLILDILPRKKQNLMFSATFSPYVEELSWNFMDFPIKIEVTPEATPVETVAHVCYRVPNLQTKLNLLSHLMRDKEAFNRVIIFVKTKTTANAIFAYCEQHISGTVRLIHSNKSQNARINAFNEFKEGHIRMLIATDVMARGVDIPEVSHVINFEVPSMPEDYVHRIGRTGRALHTGEAITFIHKADEYGFAQIERKIRMTVPNLEMPESIVIAETPYEENQTMELEIDNQRKREDPDFKGAFHEKKDYRQKRNEKQRKKTPIHTNKGRTSYTKSKVKKNVTSKYYKDKDKK
jgi:ATP-dependent RNA helicase RhlE